MSSFLVTDDHIKAVVISTTAFMGRDLSVDALPVLNETAQTLLDENLRSVGGYEGEDSIEITEADLSDPYYRLSDLGLFKAVACLDYQSCEPSDHRETAAAHYLIDADILLSQRLLAQSPVDLALLDAKEFEALAENVLERIDSSQRLYGSVKEVRDTAEVVFELIRAEIAKRPDGQQVRHIKISERERYVAEMMLKVFEQDPHSFNVQTVTILQNASYAAVSKLPGYDDLKWAIPYNPAHNQEPDEDSSHSPR